MMWFTKSVLWLQPCKRLVSPFSLWSPGVGHQSLSHCPTFPPLCPPVLVATTSYFLHDRWVAWGESCTFCPAHLMADGVEVCSMKELLLVSVHSSWGLGKKGLRVVFFGGCFGSEMMQNICQWDLHYLYSKAIELSSVLSLVSHQQWEEENIYLVQFLA